MLTVGTSPPASPASSSPVYVCHSRLPAGLAKPASPGHPLAPPGTTVSSFPSYYSRFPEASVGFRKQETVFSVREREPILRFNSVNTHFLNVKCEQGYFGYWDKHVWWFVQKYIERSVITYGFHKKCHVTYIFERTLPKMYNHLYIIV